MSKTPKKVVSVAAFKDGKLLFGLRNDSGKWNFPGGHVEDGEDIQDAARRELLEETALNGTAFEYLGFADVSDEIRVYSFICKVNGEPDAKDDPDEEMGAFKWLDPKSLPKSVMANLHNTKDVTLQFLNLQERTLKLIWDEDAPSTKEVKSLTKAEPLAKAEQPPQVKAAIDMAIDSGDRWEVRPLLELHHFSEEQSDKVLAQYPTLIGFKNLHPTNKGLRSLFESVTNTGASLPAVGMASINRLYQNNPNLSIDAFKDYLDSNERQHLYLPSEASDGMQLALLDAAKKRPQGGLDYFLQCQVKDKFNVHPELAKEYLARYPESPQSNLFTNLSEDDISHVWDTAANRDYEDGNKPLALRALLSCIPPEKIPANSIKKTIDQIDSHPEEGWSYFLDTHGISSNPELRNYCIDKVTNDLPYQFANNADSQEQFDKVFQKMDKGVQNLGQVNSKFLQKKHFDQLSDIRKKDVVQNMSQWLKRAPDILNDFSDKEKMQFAMGRNFSRVAETIKDPDLRGEALSHGMRTNSISGLSDNNKNFLIENYDKFPHLFAAGGHRILDHLSPEQSAKLFPKVQTKGETAIRTFWKLSEADQQKHFKNFYHILSETKEGVVPHFLEDVPYNLAKKNPEVYSHFAKTVGNLEDLGHTYDNLLPRILKLVPESQNKLVDSIPDNASFRHIIDAPFNIADLTEENQLRLRDKASIKDRPSVNAVIARKSKSPKIVNSLVHELVQNPPDNGLNSNFSDILNNNGELLDDNTLETMAPHIKNPRYAQRIQDLRAYHNPDAVHSEAVQVRPGLGRVRKVRDFISENASNGEMPPKQLPPPVTGEHVQVKTKDGKQDVRYQPSWKAVQEPNGNVSAKKLQEYIDAHPPFKWNVSHTEWDGSQRHSDEDSKVFQLNLSTGAVNRLKEAGVYDTFRKMAEESGSSGHPVTPHTIGWVRYTGTPQHGVFVDEVQSDFGQSFVKQAQNQARERALEEAKDKGMSPEDAKAHVEDSMGQATKQMEAHFPEQDYKKISDVLFGGKHPNEHVAEGFMQYMRDTGNHNANINWHSVYSKAPISGIELTQECANCKLSERQHEQGNPKACQNFVSTGKTVRTDAPGHFNVTYNDLPQKLGMEQSVYSKKIAPTMDNEEKQGEPTFMGPVRKYAESHSTDRVVLEKGMIPELATAALLAVSSGDPSASAPKVQNEEWVHSLPSELHSIAYLESNCGKHIDHKPHSGGEFETAYGALGLKPSTAFQQYNNSIRLQRAYPGLQDHHNFLLQFKGNPQFYGDIAQSHWKTLKNKLGSTVKAAFAWRHGMGAAENTSDEEVVSDNYVKRYANHLGSDQLAKTKGPMTFPQLGVKDNRKETLQITEPKQERRFMLAFANRAIQAMPQHKETIREQVNNDTVTNQGAATVHGAPISYARAHSFPRNKTHTLGDAIYENPNVGLATQNHEDMHNIFQRVQNKYGNAGRYNLVAHLWNSLDNKDQDSLNQFMRLRRPGLNIQRNPHDLEEYFTTLLNYLNNPGERKAFHSHAANLYGYSPKEAKAHEYTLHNSLKSVYKYLHGVAKKVTSQDIAPMQGQQPQAKQKMAAEPVKKSSNLDATPAIPGVALDMLGFIPSIMPTFEAARFLVNGAPLNMEQVRRALWQHDGDPEAAALSAYGIEVNEKNRKALASVHDIRKLHKNDITEAPIKVARATNPEGEHIAQAVERAIKDHFMMPVKLGGKYSNGTVLVEDQQEKTAYLLKPNPTDVSPALGIKQDASNASQREAAFYDASKVLGLDGDLSDTALLDIDGQYWAAFKVISWDFKSLDKANKQNHFDVLSTMNRLLNSGKLHKWAVMDAILGNVDRHGANLLYNPKTGELKLIDHGSAFAGTEFDPGADKNSFVPFYLRIWNSSNFNAKTPEDKLASLPVPSSKTEKELNTWIGEIDRFKLAEAVSRYGIDPKPILARLDKVKSLMGPGIAKKINALWCEPHAMTLG